ncbi:MAG: murein L,D-transpeptidase family protein [Methyloceanibacter sp.]
MLRQVLWLLIAVAIFAAVFALFSRDGRQLIDRASIALTRHTNHSYYRRGVPLPGTPELAKLDERLNAEGLQLGAPVFLRIFKLESKLELWMEKDGRYRLFATYPICLWSGRLGPKLQEGDLQAPEGFYAVTKEQLNPNSRWHRSFNLGFPNDFDRSHGRTGSFLMVHGGCLSVGCYAMTDDVVDEIWRLVTAALDRGQPRFEVQVFPFRLTERNLAARTSDQWSPFWAELKRGYDAFERTHKPPAISVCDGRYVVAESDAPGGSACPATASASGSDG